MFFNVHIVSVLAIVLLSQAEAIKCPDATDYDADSYSWDIVSLCQCAGFKPIQNPNAKMSPSITLNLNKLTNKYQFPPNPEKWCPSIGYDTKCSPQCINGVCQADGHCTCFKDFSKKEDSETECIPICNEGCKTGKCESPYKCSDCEDGFKINNGVCVKLVCTQDCGAGVCGENNTCICPTDYTHKGPGTPCEPTCQLGCKHCTTPNKCDTCEQHYVLNKDTCVLPTCDDPKCGPNEECIDMNKCECKVGYSKKNTGQCTMDCVEGCDTCKSPSECERCKLGYSLATNGTCTQLVCTQDCGAGVCGANNTCICPTDYTHKGPGTPCEPTCQLGCKHCTAPNKCDTCEQHYVLNKDTCVLPTCDDPKCGPNEECIDMNKCECKVGYSKKNTGQCTMDCVEGCDTCKSPSECERCKLGYSLATNGTCTQLVCTQDCGAGVCGENNTCICPTDYTHKGPGTPCEPTCQLGCKHCTTPNKCDTCEQHYVLNKDTCVLPDCPTNSSRKGSDLSCTADCNPPCEHGVCKPAGICECIKGFENLNGKCTEQVCPVGFTKKGGDVSCTATCSPPCSHGMCMEPDTCGQCNEGYVLKDNKCIEIKCDPKCGSNEECIDMNKCECKVGYSKKNTGQCTMDCVEGCDTCKSPSECERCKVGYSLATNGTCTQLVCTQDCGAGVCGANNTCICPTDYTHKGPGTPCEPTCQLGCKHCTAPNKCDTCEQHYVLNNGTCKLPPCENGYSRKQGDPSHSCTADCNTPCNHGACVDHNVCGKCHPGYVLQDNQCIPDVPRNCVPECVNSKCEKGNSCVCFDNYSKSKHSNICTPNCGEGCNNCTAPFKCSSCKPKYDLIKGNCTQRISPPSSQTNQMDSGKIASIVIASIVGGACVAAVIMYIRHKRT